MLLGIGTPKAGTHLLGKSIEGFKGLNESVETRHFLVIDPRIENYNINKFCIHRLPRNIIFSWLRFTKKPITTKNVLNEIPLTIKRIHDFLPWLCDPNTLNIKFEHLLTIPAVLEDMADHVGMEVSDGQFENLYGGTRTFTNDLSNWENYWNGVIDDYWTAKGGKMLEDILQYDPKQKFIRNI